MSNEHEFQYQITNSGPSYFEMDDAFCARMRTAIKGGLESAPIGVITTPGTQNPRYVSNLTAKFIARAERVPRRRGWTYIVRSFVRAILRASPGTGRCSKPISVPRPLPDARIAVTDIGIRDRRRSSNYQTVRGRPID